MPQAQPANSRMSVADFLAWDARQAVRHEFFEGEVRAVSDVDERHTAAALNIANALREHLRNTRCRTFMSDMKLHVVDAFFYPDVLVTCGDADRANDWVKSEPRLLVEVLSPDTASYDCGPKFTHYRQSATLQEVLFVDPVARCAEVHRRAAVGQWTAQAIPRGEAIHLASVDLSMTAATVFAGM